MQPGTRFLQITDAQCPQSRDRPLSIISILDLFYISFAYLHLLPERKNAVMPPRIDNGPMSYSFLKHFHQFSSIVCSVWAISWHGFPHFFQDEYNAIRRGRGHVPPPQQKKIGKNIFFGQLLCKIPFKFGHFSGKYHKNSGILIIFFGQESCKIRTFW